MSLHQSTVFYSEQVPGVRKMQNNEIYLMCVV